MDNAPAAPEAFAFTGRAPRPFVKWAGGKRQLLDVLRAASPGSYGHYFEPFVGGGALLFGLTPSPATISDTNAQLIDCYTMIRDALEALLQSLSAHRNEEAYYYTVRAQDPFALSQLERASRFIYLNKTCFNGLYRENSKGLCNSPFGRYEKPNFADHKNLAAVSAYLRAADVRIHCRGFAAVLDEARAGDFVYFDPPYIPLTRTANFTNYTRSGFGDAAQRELAAVFAELARRNVLVMLSNADTPFMREMYAGFRILPVEANRNINCKGAKRAREAKEVLVLGY